MIITRILIIDIFPSSMAAVLKSRPVVVVRGHLPGDPQARPDIYLHLRKRNIYKKRNFAKFSFFSVSITIESNKKEA